MRKLPRCMPAISGHEGTSLLELIIAVTMITIAVTTIALSFPKASAALTNRRQHSVASAYAQSKLQELKEQSYALVEVTPAVDFGGVPNCNCSIMNMASLPTTPPSPYLPETLVDSGVPYVRTVCVNLTDLAGTNANCPDGPPVTDASDHGLKKIRIQVAWGDLPHPKTLEVETSVTRQ